ncbi:MAG: hypothetical protein HYU48_02205 [Candidatus Levybacteria bacterium]|nr:hypothetical protein [Candidatus Levybacteria bacterium]
MSEAYILVSLVRIVASLAILKWPLFGVLASIYIDVNDFDLLNLQNQTQWEAYQVWDKVFDTWYLLLAAFVSLRWKDKLAKKISISSFFYRLLGVLVSPLMGTRSILIFFPNFFENFFLFYMIFTKFSKGKILLSSRFDAVVILTAILIPSLAREYFIHVIRTPPWEAYNITKVLGVPRLWSGIDISYWVWILILLFLPVSALIWKIVRVKKEQSKYSTKNNLE